MYVCKKQIIKANKTRIMRRRRRRRKKTHDSHYHHYQHPRSEFGIKLTHPTTQGRLRRFFVIVALKKDGERQGGREEYKRMIVEKLNEGERESGKKLTAKKI